MIYGVCNILRPQGAMHSKRKVNLGHRNGIAMLELRGQSLEEFGLASSSGPVLKSATIEKQGVALARTNTSTNSSSSSSSSSTGVASISSGASYKITLEFDNADNLHFAGAACCTTCCKTMNGSAVQLRIANASDPTGYTWKRSNVPTVSGPSTVTAVFTASDSAVEVSTTLLRFLYEGEPECVLYNGDGGPDNKTAVAASPFYVSLGEAGSPTLVPATPCTSMLQNGSCAFEPEPCTGFSNVTCPSNRCCWSPTINGGQCLPQGTLPYKGQACTCKPPFCNYYYYW